MLRPLVLGTVMLLATAAVWSDEVDDAATVDSSSAVESESNVEKEAVDGPKTMSGMSILGNEEAPKSLVIIPWKSSELGEDISLTNTLDDRAQPVDKEVFLRELQFYKIRSGE